MKIGSRVTLNDLRTSWVLLGIGLLVAACGGGSDQMTGAPEQDAMPGEGGGSMMTQLGAWNVPMPGGLDVSDANGSLRAYYDSSGGHVVADAPVQPEGMGTATWTGMWSGRVDVEPAAVAALTLVGLPSDFPPLSGGAIITAYFGSNGAEADLTYQDIGLDDLGLSALTSERVPVTGGRFEPEITHSIQIPLDATTVVTVTGDFAGDGAFGGANAEGVAGYMSGGISAPGLGTGELGTFKSVFYGDKDAN